MEVSKFKRSKKSSFQTIFPIGDHMVWIILCVSNCILFDTCERNKLFLFLQGETLDFFFIRKSKMTLSWIPLKCGLPLEHLMSQRDRTLWYNPLKWLKIAKECMERKDKHPSISNTSVLLQVEHILSLPSSAIFFCSVNDRREKNYAVFLQHFSALETGNSLLQKIT